MPSFFNFLGIFNDFQLQANLLDHSILLLKRGRNILNLISNTYRFVPYKSALKTLLIISLHFQPLEFLVLFFEPVEAGVELFFLLVEIFQVSVQNIIVYFFVFLIEFFIPLSEIFTRLI